jgi:DNA-binding transcriptional ArsR family regulator
MIVQLKNYLTGAYMENKAKPDAPVCDCDFIHNSAVVEVKAAMPAYGEFLALANLYKMFADPTRVRILYALSRRELCVCDIANLLGMTKSAVSHQLRGLRMSNLVKYRREGQVVFYSLADGHVEAIFEKGIEHIAEKQGGAL